MILRSLEVEQFRRHNIGSRVAFNERFTVIHGPNEAGKSTLFQSLQYAFFRRSSAGGGDIDKLMPWGSSKLRPQVVVEFAFQGNEFRLEKTFGANGKTLVHKRNASGRFEPHLADDADDFVTKIFAGEPPGKGMFSAFRPAHLGLGHLLFAPQGRIAIRGEEKDLALNADAQSRMSRLIGSAAQTPHDAALIKCIEESYAKIFGKIGNLKKAAKTPGLRDSLKAIGDRIINLERTLQNYEVFAAEYQEALAHEKAMKGKHAEAVAAAKSARPRFTAALELKSTCQMAESAFSEAEKAYTSLVGVKRQIEELREALEKLRPKHAALSTRRVEAEDRLREATRDRDLAIVARNAAYGEDTSLNQLRVRRGAARLLEELKTEARDLEARCRRIVEFDAKLAQFASEIESLTLCDQQTIDELQALLEQRHTLKTTIEHATTKVQFVAERRLTLVVAASAETAAIDAQPGMPVSFSHDGKICITIDGVGQFEIQGPVSDIVAERHDLADVNERIASIERTNGSADPHVLRMALVQADSLRSRQSEVTRERDAQLQGKSVAEIDARMTTLTAELSTDKEDIATIDAQIEERERALAAARTTADEHSHRVELAWETARGALDQEERQCIEIDAQLRNLQNQLLNVAPQSQTDEQRKGALDAAFRQLDERRRELEAANIAYRPYQDIVDPKADLERHQSAADDLQSVVADAERSRNQREDRVREIAAAGPSTALAEALEERERLNRDLESEGRSEAAIGLLHEIAKSIVADRTASFARPVLDRVAPWYERLTGLPIDEIQLDEHHAMRGIALPGVDRAISWEELSGGASDQLALLIRLGFATLLADPEQMGRVPMLLDDPLVNCDAVRRVKMLDILREMSSKVQIIVFTCRPEDYAGSGATVTSIESTARVALAM